MNLPGRLSTCKIIGLGVTEAGLVPQNPIMNHLAEFLFKFYSLNHDAQMSIINTDNMPSNGNVVQECLEKCDFVNTLENPQFNSWLASNVTCHNTMVDRITAARSSSEYLVPRAEPLPTKALVIEDLKKVLPPSLASSPGVILRQKSGEIDIDHLLKLRIANATHSAMVYAMALAGLKNTTDASDKIFTYLDNLYKHDILPGLLSLGVSRTDANGVYDDWISRLRHRYFGMSTFFVCQNASVKCSVRLLSNVVASLEGDSSSYIPSVYMAYAVAAILRYLTPFSHKCEETDRGVVFQGGGLALKLQEKPFEYTTGLVVDFSKGFYFFTDPKIDIPNALLNSDDDSITVCSVMAMIDGSILDLSKPCYRELLRNVVSLYKSLKHKDALDVRTLCSSWL